MNAKTNTAAAANAAEASTKAPVFVEEVEDGFFSKAGTAIKNGAKKSAPVLKVLGLVALGAAAGAGGVVGARMYQERKGSCMARLPAPSSTM